MTDKKTEELIAYALKRVDRQIEDAFLGPFGASLTEGSPSEEIMQCLAKSAEKFQRDDNNTIRIYASACLALLGRAWKAEAALDEEKALRIQANEDIRRLVLRAEQAERDCDIFDRVHCEDSLDKQFKFCYSCKKPLIVH